MTDILGCVLTGLFTGLGVYLANYLGENHLKEKLKHLDHIEEIVKDIKNSFKPMTK